MNPAWRGLMVMALGTWMLCLGGATLRAQPTASNDLAVTGLNHAITISVLTNDGDASNQMALLLATKPAHGTVVINSNMAVLTPQLSNLFSFAAVQLSNTVIQVANSNLYPRRTLTNGPNIGKWTNSNVNDWIGGFFPGCMWYVYEQTGDTNFKTWARKWTGGIKARTNDTSTDDIGFMINTSFGNGLRITGDTNYLPDVLNGANTLGKRYNTTVRSIADDTQPSGTNFQVILDTMMNGDLLYYESLLNGDTNLSFKIYNHQLRAMTNQIRSDNSTFHMVYYSTVNGNLFFQGTRAGYSNSSTWARGHAWTIYMFTRGYQVTGYLPFLDAAQRVADYYITNVPSDFVPYWDFQAPNIPNEPRDSSAASITLSALINLSEVTTNLTNSARYWAAAHNIFESLASTNYLAQGTVSSGILLHGVGETPVLPTPEVDVSLIYGDYYFIESMRRFALAYGQNTLTYTPEPGFTGTDTFTYEVGDSAGNCATATVTVVVQPTNAPPAFAAMVSVPPATPQPTVTFPSTSGYLYDVQYNDSLSTTNWLTLAPNLVGNGSNISVCDSNLTGMRFYRVREK